MTPPKPAPSSPAILAELPWVRSLAHRLVQDAGLADDLVQDACVAALRRDGGEPPSRGWLAKVLQNALFQHRRRQGSRRHHEQQSADTSLAAPSSAELVERLECQRVVMDAVESLQDPYRSTLLLRYCEGLSAAEIARRLQLPAATVRSRQQRGLEQLRLRLNDRFGDARSWALLLLPIAKPSLGLSATKQVGIGAALMMKKTALATAAVLLATSAWLWHRTDVDGPQVGPPSAGLPHLAASSPPENPVAQRAEGGASRQRSDDEQIETPIGRPPEPVVPAAAGWWLNATLLGRPEDAEPGELTVQVVGPAYPILPPLRLPVTAWTHARLDLAPLFEHETMLVEKLELRIDLPNYLPWRSELTVSRSERLGGYRVADPTVFAIDVELTPAVRKIRGRVTLPPGHDFQDLLLATYPARLDTEVIPPPIDQSRCDGQGNFVLRARDSKPVQVVVWTDGARKPARFVQPLSRVAESAEMLLELSEGAVIRGRVAGGSTSGRSRTRIRARLDHPAKAGLSLRGDAFGLVLRGDVFGQTLRDHVFDYGACEVWSQPGGEFDITGLRAGRYSCRAIGIESPDSPPSETETTAAHTLWVAGVPVTKSVTAPAEHVQLAGLPDPVFLRVHGGGQPLAGTNITIRSGKNKRTSTQIGESGVICLLAAPMEKIEIRLEKSGYETQTLPESWATLQARRTNLVELRRQRPPSTLVLRFHGDEPRTSELFRLRLYATEGENQVLLERRIKRDRSSTFRVHDLPEEGTYRFRVEAIFDSFPDPGCLVSQIDGTLTLTPGRETYCDVPLVVGGRIRVRGTHEVAASPLLYDRNDQLLDVMVYDLANRGSMNFIPPRPDWFDLFPNLPAGSYRLRLEGHHDPDFETTVVVKPGAITEIDLNSGLHHIQRLGDPGLAPTNSR